MITHILAQGVQVNCKSFDTRPGSNEFRWGEVVAAYFLECSCVLAKCMGGILWAPPNQSMVIHV